MSKVELISRKDALSQGLKRYYTGEPCNKKGHLSERLTSNHACMACMRENAQADRRMRPEFHRIRDKEIYAKNADRKRRESKEWKAKNPERVKAYAKNWNADNVEKIRDRDAQRWQLKGGELYKKNREWRARNPEVARSYSVIRERRKELPYDADERDFTIFVLQQAAEACVNREKRHGFKWHVDHMIPLSKGGSHSWGNIQLLPHFLNRRKYNKMWLTKPFEWLDHL